MQSDDTETNRVPLLRARVSPEHYRGALGTCSAEAARAGRWRWLARCVSGGTLQFLQGEHREGPHDPSRPDEHTVVSGLSQREWAVVWSVMGLENEAMNVVNAAKAWHRADDSNRERREKRLHQMVENYRKAEIERNERAKGPKAHREAATESVWIDTDGNRTPYSELEGKHLFNIRRKLKVDHQHFDGIVAEVQRRADRVVGAGSKLREEDVIWTEGIPFTYEKSLPSGDEQKVSFRNLLTRKLEHLRVDAEGHLKDWSHFGRHGLTSDQAYALCHAWRDEK